MEEEELEDDRLSKKLGRKSHKEKREETINKEKNLGLQSSIESMLGRSNMHTLIKILGL
jgi:hypothetical protein